MANAIDILSDLLERVQGEVHRAVDGLDAASLNARPAGDPDANTISWLAWHIARGQDAQIAEVAGFEAVWTAAGWNRRFALDLPDTANGYGFTREQVGKVRVDDPELLTGYYDAVHESTRAYIAGLRETDLDRVVDRNWTPPVTLAVRIVSILNDEIQHAGQAAYARGLLLRAS